MIETTPDDAPTAPPAPRLHLVRGLLAASGLLLLGPAVLLAADEQMFQAAALAVAALAHAAVLQALRGRWQAGALRAARLLAATSLLLLGFGVLLPSLL